MKRIFDLIEAIGRAVCVIMWHRPWFKAGDVLDYIDSRVYESWESKPLARIQIQEVGINKYRIIDWWDAEGNSSGTVRSHYMCYIHSSYKKVKTNET